MGLRMRRMLVVGPSLRDERGRMLDGMDLYYDMSALVLAAVLRC